MRNLRLVVLGSAAAVSLAGIGIAAAGSGDSQSVSRATTRAHVITQLHGLELKAAGNPKLSAALHRAEVALVAQPADRQGQPHGRPSSPPPPCPSQAPNAGGSQPCGVAGLINKVPHPCPSHAPNGGGVPPCGHPSPKPTTTATSSPTPTGTTGPAACGPADAGGTPATGPISGVLYDVGLQISNGGGAPLGDAVQTIACAVFVNLGL